MLPVEIRRNIYRIWSSDKSRLLEKLVNSASSFQRREFDRIGYPAPFCMVDVLYKKFRIARILVNILPEAQEIHLTESISLEEKLARSFLTSLAYPLYRYAHNKTYSQDGVVWTYKSHYGAYIYDIYDIYLGPQMRLWVGRENFHNVLLRHLTETTDKDEFLRRILLETETEGGYRRELLDMADVIADTVFTRSHDVSYRLYTKPKLLGSEIIDGWEDDDANRQSYLDKLVSDHNMR